MVVPPQEQSRLTNALNGVQTVKIGLDVHGSTTLYQ